jgi:hypothetical protein
MPNWLLFISLPGTQFAGGYVSLSVTLSEIICQRTLNDIHSYLIVTLSA